MALARGVRFTPAPDTAEKSENDSNLMNAMESPGFSLIRKLNFTLKEVQTPHRNQARHRVQEPFSVCLRVRPPVAADGHSTQSTVLVNSDSQVETVPPSDSASFKSGERGSQYTFSHAFAPDASQQDVYERTAAPLVRSLVQGKNGLLFAYGITNSGKTWTIQGTREQPGITPRVLSDLFRSLQTPSIFNELTRAEPAKKTKKPMFQDLANDDDSANDSSQRSSLSNGDDTNCESRLESAMRALESKLQAARSEGADSVDSSFASDCEELPMQVWISYLEIYNEQLYDLLDPNAAQQAPMVQAAAAAAAAQESQDSSAPVAASATTGSSKGLRLMTQRDGSVYVHGLREVEVRSLPEALCVLDRGQRHRMVAETQLNRGSSRSHAVLTIKLVKPGTDKDRDGIVAKMSIVDLAGAERSDRTGNTGKRAREAIKINTSLMQLGRCLEVLRQNQLRPQHPQPVPFRDSNVTRLFQDYLTGYGRTVMLTTVSGAQADFDETAHALRYAAIAREIKEIAVTALQRVQKKTETQTAREREREQSVKARATTVASSSAAARSARKDDHDNVIIANSKATAASKRAVKVPVTKKDTVKPVAASARNKRLSDISVEELASEGDDSFDEFDEIELDDKDQQIENMLEEMYTLKLSLVAAEQRCAAVEQTVRAEVSAASESQAKEIEEMYQQQLASQTAAAEAKFERKLAIRERLLNSQIAQLQEQVDASGGAAVLPASDAKTVAALAAAQAAAGQFQSEARAAQNALTKAQKEAEQYQQESRAATASLTALRAELTRVQNDAKSQQSDAKLSSVALAAAQTLSAQLKSELQATDADLTKARAEVTKAEAASSKLKAEISTLEAMNTKLKADLKASEAGATKTRSELTALEKKSTKQLNELENVKSELSTVQTQLTESLAAAAAVAAAHSSSVSELQTRLTQSEQALKWEQDRVTQLSAALETARTSLAAFRAMPPKPSMSTFCQQTTPLPAKPSCDSPPAPKMAEHLKTTSPVASKPKRAARVVDEEVAEVAVAVAVEVTKATRKARGKVSVQPVEDVIEPEPMAVEVVAAPEVEVEAPKTKGRKGRKVSAAQVEETEPEPMPVEIVVEPEVVETETDVQKTKGRKGRKAQEVAVEEQEPVAAELTEVTRPARGRKAKAVDEDVVVESVPVVAVVEEKKSKGRSTRSARTSTVAPEEMKPEVVEVKEVKIDKPSVLSPATVRPVLRATAPILSPQAAEQLNKLKEKPEGTAAAATTMRRLGSRFKAENEWDSLIGGIHDPFGGASSGIAVWQADSAPIATYARNSKRRGL